MKALEKMKDYISLRKWKSKTAKIGDYDFIYFGKILFFESSLLIHLRKWDVGPHSFFCVGVMDSNFLQ